MSLEGTWVGHRKVIANPNASSGLLSTASQVKLVIDDESKFQLEDGGVPKSGEVQYAGHSAVLIVKAIFNQSMEQQSADVQKRTVPIQVTLQKDGSLDFYDPSGFDPEPLSLKKQSPAN